MARLLPSLVTVRDEKDENRCTMETTTSGKQGNNRNCARAMDTSRRASKVVQPDRITISLPSELSTNVGHEPVQTPIIAKVGKAPRRGAINRFPEKLHTMLSRAESEKFDHIVSWEIDGMSFKVHEPQQFLATIMPHYFKQHHLRSFQRQLNLYGFSRLHSVCDRGWYYHKLFRRDQLELCQQMERVRIKGTTMTHKIPPSPKRDKPKIPSPLPQRSETPSSASSSATSYEWEVSNLVAMEISKPVSPMLCETNVSVFPNAAVSVTPSVSPFSYKETRTSSSRESSSTDDLLIASTDDGTECRILSLLSTSSLSFAAFPPDHHDDNENDNDIGSLSTLRQLLDDYSIGRDLVGLDIQSA